MTEKVIIKKYPNRRLYDTRQSNYVSLNHLSDLIREGKQVEVIDASSNEDITCFILTQIILEEAKHSNILLPVSLLHLIIQYGETYLKEFFEKFLEVAIQGFIAYKTAFDEQFKSWLQMGINFSNLAPFSMNNPNPFEAFFNPFQDPTDNKKTETDSD